MKIGFIGCGNMARAIINGIIQSNIYAPEQIYASAVHREKLNAFCSSTGICAAANETIAKECSTVILAVKPQKFEEVLPAIKVHFADVLVISIAAGKTTEDIEKLIGTKRIIRIMPNLNAAIGESVSALCANAYCRHEDTEAARNIFESIGKVYEIEESAFSAFSATACCSPAFSFMYMDALAKAGIACGLEENIAYQAATDAVLGSAKMLMASSEKPEQLVQKVCSPGGTTIEGVNVLRKKQMEQMLMEAVRASYEKDKQL